MPSFLSRFSKSPRLQDNEKAGYAYEQDTSRLVKSTPTPARNRLNDDSTERYLGSFAPNPAFIRLLRFLCYSLTSLSALATAGVGLGVVHYYNNATPVIKPAWGSLIAVIAFGIGTPGVLFGLFLVTPRLFRHGGVAGIINQTRIELLMLFSMAVVWISGALALACDLRGRENCIWDGYYHYPKPLDFDNVCELINVSVALAYTTFGLCCLQMVIFWSAVIYILLYLDQEVLTEPTNDCGGRAYRARTLALAQHRTVLNAQRASTVLLKKEMSGVSSSFEVANSRRASQSSRPETRSERYRDEEETGEREEEESHVAGGEGYYGYETSSRMQGGRV